MKLSTSTPAPTSLRICHLADIHLGYRRFNRLTKGGFNQREYDVNVAFREAIDRVIKLKPDLVVIAGDLFHTVRPSNAVLTFCFRELRRATAALKIPFVIIAGNHETPRRIDSGCALRILNEIEGIYIADSKLERFTFPQISTAVLCVPHAALNELEPTAVRAADEMRFNILVTHAQIDERLITDFGGALVDLNKLSPHEWDYIALGHVHFHHPVALNAAYAGSIEYTSANIWGESLEKKGFLEVELPAAKRTFHALTTPRQVLALEVLNAERQPAPEVSRMIQERLEAVPGGLEGKIVRLEIRNLSREVFSQLDHKMIRRFRAQALNLTVDIRAPEAQTVFSGRGATRAGLAAELELFCGEVPLEGVSTDELRTLYRTYMTSLEAEDEAALA